MNVFENKVMKLAIFREPPFLIQNDITNDQNDLILNSVTISKW